MTQNGYGTPMSWLTSLGHIFRVEPSDKKGEDQIRSSKKWRLWQVEPTRDCNLSCLMCPWPGLRSGPSQSLQMGEQTWNRLLPHLDEVESIDFTGSGEPLLNPHLFKWLKEAGERGCHTGFLTNGTLLDEDGARQVIEAGLEWIGFSIDGAEKEVYERIRKGADFGAVTSAIEALAGLRHQGQPLLMINFVIMEQNLDQLEGIIRLARKLGVDQVNFKQCDVSRDGCGGSLGLFETEKSKRAVALKKRLDRVRNLGKKLGVATTAFSFYPDQQPVCDQDPRDSLFIRSDGIVAPCINLAYGGSSQFFGQSVLLPDTHFGDIGHSSAEAIWTSEPCLGFRRCFAERVASYNASLAAADLGHDLIKLGEAFDRAEKAMIEPPSGCATCHYLYGV